MMRDDDRDPAAQVPFVRTGPPADLWPRIESAARSSGRTRRVRTWSLRIAAVAAGAALWIGGHALFAPAPASGRASSTADAARAWLWDGTGELPPEAQLVTQLVHDEEAR